MAAANQLAGLMSLLQGIQGSTSTTKTSGGTQTQQTNLSDDAVQEQIKRILAGSGGVRDIGNSARKTGLYNSTSEDLLLGNLYATAANQGEIARAPIVSTSTGQTSTTSTPGAGIGSTAGLIGGAALLNKVLSSDVVGNGISSLFDSLGLGSSGGKKTSNNDLDVGNAGGGFNVGSDGSVGVSASAGSGGWNGDTFAASMGQGLSGDFSSGVGASGNVQGKSQDFDLLGSIGSAVSGFFSGGGLGGVLGAITGGTGSSSGGSGGGSSGGSVICTALKDKGLLDKELHAAGAEYLSKMHPLTVVGYQVWGRKIAAKIDQGHKGWTKVTLPFARSRTSLLASSGSFMDHVKHPLGTFTKFIGEPVCHLIGLFVPETLFIQIFQSRHNPKGV